MLRVSAEWMAENEMRAGPIECPGLGLTGSMGKYFRPVTEVLS